jgi:hypothetical protein
MRWWCAQACKAAALAAQLGDRLNIYPVKGYSITVNLEDSASQQAAPMVSLLDDETKLVTSRLGVDRFRVAGTAEFNGINRDIRAERIRPLVNWVNQCFPGVNTRRVKVGIGPSSSHTVGPMRAARLFVLGLQHSGLLAATTRLHCGLYGSLGATGKGHGSDTAVLLGLCGHEPDTVDVNAISSLLADIRQAQRLNVLGATQRGLARRAT